MSQGITTYNGGALAGFPFLSAFADPARNLFVLDHFMGSTIAITTSSTDTYQWNTTIDTGATTLLDAAVSGGTINILSAASKSAELNSWNPIATPAAGRRITFQARFKVSSVAVNTGCAYLGLTDTVGSGTTPAIACNVTTGVPTGTQDVVGFAILPTSGSIVIVCGNGGVNNANTVIGTAVAGTYYEVGFVVDGLSTVTYFLNGAQVGQVTTPANIPNSAQFIDMVVTAGSSVKTLTVDYVAVGVEGHT